MKVLIVEDEPEMLEVIAQALEQEDLLVEKATDYFSALHKIVSYEYDCIILDISLPGGSGLALLKELKNMQKTEGVLIVSAKDSVDDKVIGLQAGADDYLSKPFHQAELIARTKAILRRKNSFSLTLLNVSDLSVDTESRQVQANGSELQLNRKEYEILLYLCVNSGRLVSRTALAEKVWGDNVDIADNFDFIYSQIKNLRKKLKESGSTVKIEAVYGIGYKLTANEAT
ncbi:response regulator transcription factor [Desertivirga xinjiangensis]|uniref:response regulator transcription factor n=1 Tax=Desertivirga xinjiangensis TaxID=539206 RepID=UPI00210F114D|nr:response regulator transcription factor [Pedobacter xinjiangensis]